MTPQTLETITGDLRAHARLEPGTMLHSDQLMAKKVCDDNLRILSFYVADGPLYSLEGAEKIPTLWLTRESNNLVLRHLYDDRRISYGQSSYDLLLKNSNYRPNPEEARIAMEAKDTLRIDLTKLRLQRDDSQQWYLKISTTKYNKLNSEERKLAERFYGQGDAFVAAMSVLKKSGVGCFGIHVLNPADVQKEATKSPIALVAWSGGFGDGAGSLSPDYLVYHGFTGVGGSVADGYIVHNHSGVRGVRRESVYEESRRYVSKNDPSWFPPPLPLEIVPTKRRKLRDYLVDDLLNLHTPPGPASSA